MSDIPELTKWQVLFRNYEGTVWTSEKATFRTTKVIGSPIERPDIEILKAISEEIKIEKNKEQRHYSQKHKGLAKTPDDKKKIEFNVEKDEEIDKQLREMLDEQPQTITKTESDSESHLPYIRIDPSQILLHEINDNSRIEAGIFPLSFRCYRCGHYQITDPRNPNLTCPCCKVGYCSECGKSVEHTEGKCKDCGSQIKRSEMTQFSFVFACPRCANMEELTPRVEKLRNVQGSTIPCQDTNKDCSGHMHFWMHGSFQASYWKCEKCDFKMKVDKYCKCHIRGDPDAGIETRPSIMRPIVTSAPSLTSPLIKSYLYMGNSDVSLASLQKAHVESKDTDPNYWNMIDDMTELDVNVVKEKYGITNAFTVPEITTLTIVYGYKSGISSHPHTIPEDQRLAQLFRSGDKYHAYAVKTVGKGLVIVLDKKKIIEVLQKNNLTKYDNYEELVQHTRNHMATSNFQSLIENVQNLPLVGLMHSLEHAFFKGLTDITGLENFGSKIMLDDCCIVVFEREDLGIGGITQITKGKQGTEFKRLLRYAEKQLRICPQFCNGGCIACVFINDFNCQPYLPNEVQRWLPPNSLLSRGLSNQFFNIL